MYLVLTHVTAPLLVPRTASCIGHGFAIMALVLYDRVALDSPAGCSKLAYKTFIEILWILGNLCIVRPRASLGWKTTIL